LSGREPEKRELWWDTRPRKVAIAGAALLIFLLRLLGVFKKG